MFQIGKTLISEEILEGAFACDLKACKGACCVEGSSGAPLETEELQTLEKIYPSIKPYLGRKQGMRICSI